MSDPLAAVGLRRNSDGSVTRLAEGPNIPATSDPNAAAQVLSKDITINNSTATAVRLFLPLAAAAGKTKLPVIIYSHGGGFIVDRAASAVSHPFCAALAERTPALVVSVDYRLAPEHRLPTAYDDCLAALSWAAAASTSAADTAAGADEWIAAHADLSRCYLMGTSAGGNIAFHAGAAAAAGGGGDGAAAIRGLILHQPYFGGVERTASEAAAVDHKTLALALSDVMWELALPAGADRDHEYCNPTKGGVMGKLEAVRDKGWTVAVVGCGGDPLVDRQKAVAEALAEMGVAVAARFVDGEYHGFDLLEPSKYGIIMGVVKEIIQDH